ncbi:MAG: hypothetical protein HOH33_15875 [Verrucomicrobia bacterium]|nr:hypothetical protein [Verrucomicrobiota bacterium]
MDAGIPIPFRRYIERLKWLKLAVFLPFMLCGKMLAADFQNAKISGGWNAAVTENNKVTTVLRGEEINGNQITHLSIQLNKKGESSVPEFFIESPECEMPQLSQGIYNASSSNSILLRTADGGFIIEGMGWKWSQSQALLVISNKVSTTIRKDLIGSRSNSISSTQSKDTSNIEIQSARFSFNRANSKAIYQDNVRATDPGRLEISCGKLQIDLGEDTRGFKEVLAEDQVELKLLDAKAPIQANGGRAIYRLGNESQDVLELLDGPTWTAQGYHGRGDRIQVEASEEQQYFKVIGNAWASLDVGNIRSQPATTMTNKQLPIEIRSDQYEFDGAEVRFEGFVTASQLNTWNLTCDTLIAKISEENKTATSIEAEGNVQLSQKDGDQTLTSKANQAFYYPKAPGEETIILTGNANVETDEFLAQGQHIEMNNTKHTQSIRVNNLAILDLPIATASSIGILNLQKNSTNNEQSQEPKRIRITSNEYALAGNKAEFKGKVSIHFQDGTLNCNTLEVLFSPDRKWIENIFATGAINLIGEQGRMTCREITGIFSESDHQMERLIAEGNVLMTHPKGKAKGDIAVFHPLTQMVELKGTPRIMTTLENKSGKRAQHILAEGETLLWDQANHRFNGPRGHYRIKTIKNPDVW